MMIIKYPPGATPLDASEVSELIPGHITTLEGLNRWEERNILRALTWAEKQRDILSITFIKQLHYRMFDETWRWAGKFRTSEKNIGMVWHAIPTETKKLCDDVLYQLSNTTYPLDEIAVRFHHRLVWIHPFPNGNGRHARLMANLLLVQLGQKPFSWGMHGDLVQETALRKSYIAALQKADRDEGYDDLLSFARS